jgi:hypothetical protein
MPVLINFTLIGCLVASIIVAILDYWLRQNLIRLIIYFLGLIAIVIILRYNIDFPSVYDRRAFGKTVSPEICVAVMFLCVVLGIMATYVFNISGKFVWLDFVRPLVVSPLILLPLIGSVQGASLEPLQLICFAILAFQNGFFWQQVLRDAKPRT